MKQIIDRKIYDTEKASLLTLFEHQEGDPDEHYTERLYRTGNGRYFLHCSGRENSDYSEEGEIQALSEDEAICWMEFHSDCDNYVEQMETHFSHLLEEA